MYMLCISYCLLKWDKMYENFRNWNNCPNVFNKMSISFLLTQMKWQCSGTSTRFGIISSRSEAISYNKNLCTLGNVLSLFFPFGTTSDFPLRNSLSPSESMYSGWSWPQFPYTVGSLRTQTGQLISVIFPPRITAGIIGKDMLAIWSGWQPCLLFGGRTYLRTNKQNRKGITDKIIDSMPWGGCLMHRHN